MTDNKDTVAVLPPDSDLMIILPLEQESWGQNKFGFDSIALA